MEPYRVLANYKWGPGGRYARRIGRDLTELTAELGLVPLDNDDIQRNSNPAWQDLDLHAEVRMTAVPQSQGTSWHQDGDTTVFLEEMDFALVLWANRDPTEFRLRDGIQIYQPKPFEVVIARNLGAYHRRPPGLEGRRWHFRQRVEIPEHMELP